MSERREIRVHPNSTAARKWGRKTWRTTSLYAEAAIAQRDGDHVRARALRALAARTSVTTLHC